MDDVAAVRRARRAVALLFFVNGFVIGTWAAHIPLVEERLAISHSTLGCAAGLAPKSSSDGVRSFPRPGSSSQSPRRCRS